MQQAVTSRLQTFDTDILYAMVQAFVPQCDIHSMSVLSMSRCDAYNLQHKCHAYMELRIKVLGISVCHLILSNFLVTCN